MVYKLEAKTLITPLKCSEFTTRVTLQIRRLLTSQSELKYQEQASNIEEAGLWIPL